RSPYASSPMHQAVSCSTLFYLWTGSSSPVASHPAFRRRSFLRLRTASVLSDGDFHPIVGAHSQAHVGSRSRVTAVAGWIGSRSCVTGAAGWIGVTLPRDRRGRMDRVTLLRDRRRRVD